MAKNTLYWSSSERRKSIKARFGVGRVRQCGDREVLVAHNFVDVTISNLDHKVEGETLAPFVCSRQDAKNLRYAEKTLDVCSKRETA